MTSLTVGMNEKDPARLAAVIRQLTEGRSNATGVFTCAPNVAATVVTAVNCSTSSNVFIHPATAHAATEQGNGTIYIQVSDVKNGQFTVTHANSAQTDRTFFYVTLG